MNTDGPKSAASDKGTRVLAFLQQDPLPKSPSAPPTTRGKSMDVRRTSIQREDLDIQVRASTSVAPNFNEKAQSTTHLVLSSPKPVHKELLLLKYHSGPIDQRALSSKLPSQVLQDVIRVLNEMGLQVRKTDEEYKIKVIRPAAVSPVNGLMPTPLKNRSGAAKFAHMLASLPVSFVKRIRYLAQFGTQYNSGFDGHTTPEAFKKQPVIEIGEVRFNVTLRRIKNLEGLVVVDFKRLRGDIWQFKALYHDIVPRLDLRSGAYKI